MKTKKFKAAKAHPGASHEPKRIKTNIYTPVGMSDPVKKSMGHPHRAPWAMGASHKNMGK